MAMIMPDGFYPRKTFLKPFFDAPGRSPDISSSARNANNPERRLVVGFMVANSLKAD